MKYGRFLSMVLLGVCPVGVSAATAQSAPSRPKVEVRCLPESPFFRPGRPIRLAFVFQIQPGWHTYWTNPGTAGESAKVDWDLPRGWKDLGLEFPAPDRFQDRDVVVFGYENAVTLLSTLLPPGNAGSGAVRMTAHLSWLVCKDVCLGEEKTMALTLKPGNPGAPPDWMQKTARDLPEPESGTRAALRRDLWGRWVLQAPLPRDRTATGGFRFIPANPLGVDYTRVIIGRKNGDRVEFPLKIDRNLWVGGRVEGIIRQEGRPGGWRVSAVPRGADGAWLWICLTLLTAGLGAGLYLKGRRT